MAQHPVTPPSKRNAPPAPPAPAASKKEESKANAGLVSKSEAGLVVPDDIAKMLLEDEGVGRENMGPKDLAIPRLTVLQALSPICTKGDPAYVKEAEVGEIYDNVQAKRYVGENGIIVIPVTYRRTHLEWKPKRGGFVADHGADPECLKECTRNEFGQDILPSGNILIQTAEYFCVMIDPDSDLPRQVVISMASTQFKKAKLWNSLISNLMVPKPNGTGVFNPAMFYQSYKLTTVPESNEKGSWFGWKIEPYKPTLELAQGGELYMGSRNFRKSVQAGDVRIAEPEPDGGHADSIDGETI